MIKRVPKKEGDLVQKGRGPAQKWKMTLVIAYRADKGANKVSL